MRRSSGGPRAGGKEGWVNVAARCALLVHFREVGAQDCGMRSAEGAGEGQLTDAVAL